MTAVTQLTVLSRSAIVVFSKFFMLSRCFFDFSVGVGTFVTGLSQISSFFSLYYKCRTLIETENIVYGGEGGMD